MDSTSVLTIISPDSIKFSI